ncbi:uncharacterized protein LOC111863934 [Cryptotermes secundus]|uniref:uncharacterized protein LOC111863934 n=1 Tax=Cryptotermes secundus TaxID=105785 RepID=UPI000CD7BE6E|nr:uncharacterized protein LOC111863934 [Cryptotermes secundus]
MYCIIIFICLSISVNQATKLPNQGNNLSIGKKVTEELNKIKTAVLDVCKCSSYTCGCCAHLEERDIHLNSTICANVSYLVHDYGISITVTLNNHTLFNQTMSARNPPPLCIGLPYVKEFTKACVRIYDINVTTTFLHACIRVEAWMEVILIAKYEFGCFNIGSLRLSTEGKHYKASNAAIMSALDAQNQKDETSKESNVNVIVTVVGITIGLIVMTFLIIGIIAMAQKRGNASSKGLLFRSHHNYGSLVTVSHGVNTIC